MRTRVLCLSAVVLFAGCSTVHAASEDTHNDAFCASIGGQREVRHDYTYPTGQSYVMVDCETAETVYEGGLDRRSSLDSAQQALFFAALTGKQPAVVIYDTDDRTGRFEHQIRVACEMAGVVFANMPLEKAAAEQAIRDLLKTLGGLENQD